MLTELEQRQRDLHRQRHLRTILNACYHAGNQRVSELPNGQLVVSPPVNNDEPVITHNYFRPYLRQVTASWMDSHPTFDILPITDNDRERRHARRELQRLAQYYERLWLGHDVREKTAIGAQLSAAYGYEVYWDESQPRGEEWVEQYEPFAIPPTGTIECADCGNYETVQGDPPAQCRKCGSINVLRDVVEGVEGERLASAGYVPKGDVVIRLVQDGATHYDLTVGKAESPFLWVFEDRPKAELEYLFQQEIAGQEGGNLNDEVFHPLRFLRNVGNSFSLGGSSFDGTEHIVRLDRWWLEPSLYWNVVVEERTEMPDGTVLEAGTMLIEAYPTGISIARVPGENKYLACKDESHKQRFRWGVYGELLGRFDGYGVEDARSPQKRINLLQSGILIGTLRTLNGAYAVNTSLFRNPGLFNRPGGVIPITAEELGENFDINKHFAVLPPTPINQHAYALIEQARAEMQANIGEQNSSGADAPGVDNPTATAAKIALAKSATAQNLHLMAYGHCLKDTLSLALVKGRENFKGKRRIPAESDKGGIYEITPEKLEYNFLMMMKAGSHYPNLDIEKQSALLEASAAKLALIQAGVSNDQANRLVDDAFSVSLEEKAADQVSEQGEETLAGMLAYLEQARAMQPAGMPSPDGMPMAQPPMDDAALFGGEEAYESEELAGDDSVPYGDSAAASSDAGLASVQPIIYEPTPEELYLLRPVIPEALGHEQELRFWREWLSTDEARLAEPVILQAAQLYVQELVAAIMQVKAIEAQIQVSASPEMQIAAMMPPQPQQGGQGGASQGNQKPSQNNNSSTAGSNLAI